MDDIVAFSTGTFEWGDYVPESLPEWLEDDSLVLVATDDEDRAIAVSRTVMLSAREAWLHATRVDPHHRRKGLGRAMNRLGCEWARDRGAVVARLMVEDWNEPARGQVMGSGYREVSRWAAADLDISMAVVPATNGGRRVPSEERLTPGRTTEVDLAWMSWINGEIARAGRELIPRNWLFRRARPADLADAAASRSLWHSASGWIIAALEEETLDVSWLSTTDLDVRRLIKAVIDLGEGVRAEQIHMLVPRTGWLMEELERSGFTIAPSSIFERSL
jgi:GNAT superfamily N-acetyltransferase